MCDDFDLHGLSCTMTADNAIGSEGDVKRVDLIHCSLEGLPEGFALTCF